MTSQPGMITLLSDRQNLLVIQKQEDHILIIVSNEGKPIHSNNVSFDEFFDAIDRLVPSPVDNTPDRIRSVYHGDVFDRKKVPGGFDYS